MLKVKTEQRKQQEDTVRNNYQDKTLLKTGYYKRDTKQQQCISFFSYRLIYSGINKQLQKFLLYNPAIFLQNFP